MTMRNKVLVGVFAVFVVFAATIFTIDAQTDFISQWLRANVRASSDGVSLKVEFTPPASITSDFATTDTVEDIMGIERTSSGAPANGIGAGLTWNVETAAGNVEKGMTLDAVTTDVTGGSEDFDFVVGLMDAGAASAERFRVTSDGVAEATAVSALTNTVLPVVVIEHTTSGVPANNIGAGINFVQETSAANNETIMEINAVVTDATGGSEDAKFSVELMAAGAAAAEKFSIGSTGIVTLSGATTLDNATAADTLTVTETNIGLVGATTITGAAIVTTSVDISGAAGLILSNDETITNAVNGAVVTDGSFQAPSFLVQNATEGTGSLVLQSVTASSGELTGATDTIEVDIPAGALLHSCQLRVDVAVTNAGNDTWAAAYSGGSTAEIQAAGGAAAKNTKVNTFFDAFAATAITSGETDITLTPQGADFTGGEITAVCYYYTLTALTDAP